MNKKDIRVLLTFCLIVFATICFIDEHELKKESFTNIIMSSIPNEGYDEEVKYENVITNLRKENNNEDIKAVLKIENTNNSWTIPQGRDNIFYLRHLLDKTYSRLGTPFLDYRININSDSKLLIYGHNSSKYNMPFKELENYYDKSYYDEHKYIDLITENSFKKYEIFSVYVEVKDYAYYQKIDFNDQKDWYNHILNLKKNSWYDTGVNILKDDKILILQTCSTHKDYKKYAHKFLLIIAKEVKNNETN